jgi:hypothetical protein
VGNPLVYIERALVNPRGDDPGLEVVILGNTTSEAVDLSGWSLVDRNGHGEAIGALTLPAGESRPVRLSGRSAQLGNKGGTIILRDAAGHQVHAVSYAQDDVQEQGRYVRFNM